MPYLGNELATQFQAFVTQTITGDGSTGYTLDRAVANGKELLVYINNVKQEEGSGKSYTASGTTITFSEAVASGDSCYLVYLGSAVQTVTPPAGSLASYTGNASLDGAVTINESSADADFRVESNGDTHALFVDAGNDKVGIKESSPSSDLVVKQSGSTFSTASQTVALFQRNSTTGHGCKVTILSGNNTSGDLNFGDAEDEDIGKLAYDHSSNAMTFTTNTAEAMRIDSSGNVIVGSTTSPSGTTDSVHVSATNWDAVNDTSDTNVTGILHTPSGRMFSQIDGNATGVEVLLVNNIHSSGATCSLIQYRTHNSEEGSLTGNSSGLTINNVSDYRKKEKITDLTDSIDVIKTLKPRQYYYRKEFGKPTRAYAGFIAHEVQDSLLPHMTSGVKDGVVTKENKENGEHKDMEVGEPVYQTVAYGDNELITRLVGAVQELSAKVETLEAEVAKLKG
jgi:hypothetical protein